MRYVHESCKTLTKFSKSNKGHNLYKIHTRNILLDCPTPLKTCLKFQVNIISGYWDMSMIVSCMQKTLTKISKSKKGHNCVKIWYRVFGLVLQVHLMMSNKCVKFQSNRIFGLWEKALYEKLLPKLQRRLRRTSDCNNSPYSSNSHAKKTLRTALNTKQSNQSAVLPVISFKDSFQRFPHLW